MRLIAPSLSSELSHWRGDGTVRFFFVSSFSFLHIARGKSNLLGSAHLPFTPGVGSIHHMQSKRCSEAFN